MYIKKKYQSDKEMGSDILGRIKARGFRVKKRRLWCGVRIYNICL